MERRYCPECQHGMVTFGPTFDPSDRERGGVWVHVCPLGHTLTLTSNKPNGFVCNIELGNYYDEQRHRHQSQQLAEERRDDE